ncbi:MAG: hypothetical protein P4M15_07110 [Alphaproteobacteria bacterium]|nr:hypothetical protein [Alphaproteobacteria bacterium]
MTTRSGHIASLVIAGFFGLLLAAAWLPSTQDKGDSRKIVDAHELRHLLQGDITRKSTPSPSPARKPEPARMMIVGTATPAGVSEPMPQIIAPQYKEEKKAESKVMDFSWLKSFLFDIHITDIALVALVGMIWWDARNTRKTITNFGIASAAQARELTRASASMEKLAKAMTAMSAMAAVAAAANAAEPAAPVKAKPGRPRKKAGKAESVAG